MSAIPWNPLWRFLMKRLGFFARLVPAIVAGALLAFSCAGGPSAISGASKSKAAPVKVKKERTLVVRTPVLLKETTFYPDGLVDTYSIYAYDETQSKLLEKKSFDPARSDPIERVVSAYQDGKLSAEEVYDADGKVKLRREFALDPAGRVATERLLDAKGAVQSSSTYAYDAAGNRTEWRVLDAGSVLRAVTSYSYEGGKLVLIEMRGTSGAKTGSIAVEYGASGLEIKRSYFAADGSLQKFEARVYEGSRLVALETHRADASLSSKVAYAYGPDGELLSATETDSASAVREIRKFEYRIREDQKTEVYYE
jgi:YD repeat-containing protein